MQKTYRLIARQAINRTMFPDGPVATLTIDTDIISNKSARAALKATADRAGLLDFHITDDGSDTQLPLGLQ